MCWLNVESTGVRNENINIIGMFPLQYPGTTGRKNRVVKFSTGRGCRQAENYDIDIQDQHLRESPQKRMQFHSSMMLRNATNAKAMSGGDIGDRKRRKRNENHELHSTLASKETRRVKYLRLAVLGLILVTAAVVSTSVLIYLRREEEKKFSSEFEIAATDVMYRLHSLVERSLNVIAVLSNSITSHAILTQGRFPYITLPDFAVRGSEIRTLTGAHAIYFAPLITDRYRREWENFAASNHKQVQDALVVDEYLRDYQDRQFGLTINGSESSRLPTASPIDAGLQYQQRISSNGAFYPPGELPDGTGPYFPIWQLRYN